MTPNRLTKAAQLAATGVIAALLLTACSPAAPAGQGSDATSTTAPAKPVTLTVLAAASLTAVFTTIGQQFESANPGVTVRFSFDGSATLVTQISQGAPADVVALADTKTMDQLTQANLIAGSPTLFASNSLVLAVPADNPAGITSLTDLTKAGVKTVVCDSSVPCGAAADRVFTAAGVSVAPVSLESSVTAVVTKLTTGEADAGMVYGTDVAGSGGKIMSVPLPDTAAVTQAAMTSYPIAVVAAAASPDWAGQFVTFVTSGPGQATLQTAGFGPAS